MQNFPLISGQQKLPRGMKSDMSDVYVIPPQKKISSAECTTFRCYLFYLVALMNVDFSV